MTTCPGYTISKKYDNVTFSPTEDGNGLADYSGTATDNLPENASRISGVSGINKSL
ncbi:hypothetical protein LZD49_16750 [Dyadobacter sp. CY261]|uniref:hypothetical protein n=1 Tax=Dyadobacter sp. CY261 TaxID=2907203 RepID=UPI001F1836D1|nr:hypothetical protein [Dyadobacter sp. CY261]MCF0072132.1 hypothetical protein [Dyadobacter sp. CY261]